MRAVLLTLILLGLELGSGGILRGAAADPPARSASGSAPPKPRAYLPTLFVPARTDSGYPAVWDTLARLETEFRWTASDSLATALISRLEQASPVDSLELARALLYVANSLTKRRTYADGRCVASLEQAVGIRERHGGPGDRLAVWGHMLAASFFWEGGKPELARAHGERAVQALGTEVPPNRSWLSQSHLGLAVSLATLREYDAARPHYEAALRLRAEADGPDHPLLVPMLAEYGTFLSRLGEFDEARDLLRRAVRIAELEAGPGNGSDFLEGSLSRLSSLENRTGNLAESLELAQRAYELSRRRIGDPHLATVRLKTIVSYRLLDLGDYAGGASLLSEIVPAMEAGLGPQHPNTLNARLSLLEALVETGDTISAMRELATARQALAGQDPLRNSNWTYFLQLAGDLELARGHVEAARDTFLAAIDIERRKQDPVGEGMGQLYVHLLDTVKDPGDLAWVERSSEAIDRLADSTHVRGTAVWAPLVAARAGAEARTGLSDMAWTHALEAERLGRERLDYEIDALPDRNALRLAGQLGAPCDLLVSLLQLDREGNVSTAWDRIVHWRGLVRTEVARRRLPAGAHTDTALVAAHDRWTAAHRHLAQLVVSGAAHPEDPDTRERFESARRHADEMERRYIRLASGSAAPADSVHLEEVLAGLEPSQALVAFATGSDGAHPAKLGAFVATGVERKPLWVELGPVAEAEAEVRAWLAELGSAPVAGDPGGTAEAACRRLGAQVRKRLWDPLARATADAPEIFLVPEGIAAEVPWLALPGPDGLYLVDEPVALRILEAERDLVPVGRAEAGRGLLVVGGPDFDHGAVASVMVASREPSRAWRCLGSESLALPPLPGARAEAEEVAGRWPGSEGPSSVLVADAAGEMQVKQLAPGRSVVHLATHGIVVDEACAGAGNAGTRGIGGVTPLDAPKSSATPARAEAGRPASSPAPFWLGRQVWLALAGANRPIDERVGEDEGLLTAEEVVTLDLRGTDWVVLSACQSAVAPTWSREGVLGMGRAFHLAGARTVIASHWSIGDDSTREWMNALYTARAPGKPAGVAVAEACRTMLAARRQSGRSTHPFHWAAFTASGE